MTLPTDLGADLYAWYNAEDFTQPPYSFTGNNRGAIWYESPYGAAHNFDLTFTGVETGFFVQFGQDRYPAVSFPNDGAGQSINYDFGISETDAIAVSAYIHLFSLDPFTVFDLGPFVLSVDAASNSFLLSYALSSKSTSTIFKTNSLATISCITIGVADDQPYMFLNGSELTGLEGTVFSGTYSPTTKIGLSTAAGLASPNEIGELVFYRSSYSNMQAMHDYIFNRWLTTPVESTGEFTGKSYFITSPTIDSFTPDKLGPQLVFWYDAGMFTSAPYNFTVDTQIHEWQPPAILSPALEQYLVSDGSSDPFVKVNILNTLPGVAFDTGIDLYRETSFTDPDNWALSFVITLDPTLGVLDSFWIDNDSIAAFYQNVSSPPHNTFGAYMYAWLSTHSNDQFYKNDTVPAPTSITSYLVTVSHNNFVDTYRINQVDQGSLEGTPFPTNHYPQTYLELYSNDLGDVGPVLHEFLMYDPTSGNIDRVESYLHTKWFESSAMNTSITFAGNAGLVLNDAIFNLSTLGDSIYNIPVDVYPRVAAKSVRDVIDYDFDFNRWLQFTETITGVLVTSSPGLNVIGSVTSGTKIKVLITDGVVGIIHTIACQITTSSTRRKTSYLSLEINP